MSRCGLFKVWAVVRMGASLPAAYKQHSYMSPSTGSADTSRILRMAVVLSNSGNASYLDAMTRGGTCSEASP